MRCPQRRLPLILLAVAALCGSGCGDAGNQPAPKSATEMREEVKQSTTKEDVLREELKQSTAKQEEEIRKNEERIKTLREENAALQKQLEATPKPAEAAPAKP